MHPWLHKILEILILTPLCIFSNDVFIEIMKHRPQVRTLVIPPNREFYIDADVGKTYEEEIDERGPVTILVIR